MEETETTKPLSPPPSPITTTTIPTATELPHSIAATTLPPRNPYLKSKKRPLIGYILRDDSKTKNEIPTPTPLETQNCMIQRPSDNMHAMQVSNESLDVSKALSLSTSLLNTDRNPSTSLRTEPKEEEQEQEQEQRRQWQQGHVDHEQPNAIEEEPVQVQEKVGTLTSNLSYSLTSHINIPHVDRLPSRNLTFTSAEIVTITELESYTGSSSPVLIHGRSVRLIGTIRYVDLSHLWVLLSEPIKYPNLKNDKASLTSISTGSTPNRRNTIFAADRRNASTGAPSLVQNKNSMNPYKNDCLQKSKTGKETVVSSGDRATTHKNESTDAAQLISPTITPSSKSPWIHRGLNDTNRKRKLVTVKNSRGATGLGLLSNQALNKNRTDSLRIGTVSRLTPQEQQHSKPWKSIHNTITNTTRSIHSSTTSILNTRKTDTCHLHRIIQEYQHENIPLLLVDISLIPSLQNCTVGDLLMVIGEVEEVVSFTDEIETPNQVNEYSLFQVANILMERKRSEIKSVDVSSNDRGKDGFDPSNGILNEGNTSSDNHFDAKNDSNDRKNHHNMSSLPVSGMGACVKARIVRNSNGMDVNLFFEALKLRRKYLEERWKSWSECGHVQPIRFGTGLVTTPRKT